MSATLLRAFGKDEEQVAARKEKIMARLMEYSGFRNIASMCDLMAKTLWMGHTS